MKHTSTFKPALIAISITAALNSGSVVAQDTPDDEQVEIIQVSGIRGSLMRAQAVKMDNDSIVEAISAEDIGKRRSFWRKETCRIFQSLLVKLW